MSGEDVGSRPAGEPSPEQYPALLAAAPPLPLVDRVRLRVEPWLRLLPSRPGVVALVVGMVVGIVAGGLVGYLAALVAGFVTHQRMSPVPLPAGAELWRRLLPLGGRTLVAMVFFLPVAAGMDLPSGRNPDSVAKYLSLLVTEPSNLTSVSVFGPTPGAPVLVLLAFAAIVYGLRRPRRRVSMAAIVGGLGLLTLAPLITGLLAGNGVQLGLSGRGLGLPLAFVGLGMLVAARRQDASRDTLAQLGLTGGDGSPALGIALPLLALGRIGDVSLVAFIGFEAMHHGVARGIAGGLAGLLSQAAVGDELDQEDGGHVSLRLTFPAGASPTVFRSGWPFGARAVVAPGTDDERDVSDLVSWEGSGSFSPPVGRHVRARFADAGSNMIRLRLGDGPHAVVKDYPVTAVNSGGYAVVGSLSRVPADAHGCPACPHNCVGPVISGSPTVFLNNKPAVRVGDRGVHSACCGPNMTVVAEGDGSVLIDGRPAAKIGSRVRHCGGTGKIESGASG